VSEIECRVLNDVLPPSAAAAASVVVSVDAEPRQSLPLHSLPLKQRHSRTQRMSTAAGQQ